MKLTFKPYNKVTELEELQKDEDKLFKGNGAPVSVWKSYVDEDKETQFLKVFFKNEFIGILCWGIREEFGWDDKKVYFDNLEKYKPKNIVKNMSWLYAIALKDEFKGKGLSHKLMQKYELESKKSGANWLGLHVLSVNPARFLYRSEDFKQILKTEESLYMVKNL